MAAADLLTETRWILDFSCKDGRSCGDVGSA